MLESYIKIIVRGIQKQKVLTAINLAGLVVGLVSFVLIFLYVFDELTYDRFHKKAGNIYRITETRYLTEKPRTLATSYIPLSIHLQEDYPEIEQVRFSKFEGVVSYGKDKLFAENRFLYADSSIFSVFDFNLLVGNSGSVLSEPFTIVITEATAKKYFGDENPLGKMLLVDNKLPFRVTGIVESAPQNSHIKFDFLASFQTIELILGHASTSNEAWWAPQIYHYLLFPQNFDKKYFIKKFPAYVNNYIKEQIGESRQFNLQSITSIHLRSRMENELESNNSYFQVFVLAAVALFILIIACLNYMNLSTAKSLNKTKEIALRKITGASRRQIAIQYFIESLFWSFLALIITLGILEITLPYFNQISDKVLSIGKIGGVKVLFSLVVLATIVGLISGSYPAFYLSGIEPVEALKKMPAKGKGNPQTRKILIITQFAIASVLICTSLLISSQMNFIHKQNLGFSTDYLLVIPLNDKKIKDKVGEFKSELRKSKLAVKCSVSGGIPGKPMNTEFPYKTDDTPETINYPNILVFMVDYDFLKTYDLNLIEGRYFEIDSSTDERAAFIINEAAQKSFGWERNVIGRNFTLFQFNGQTMETKEGKIVGVVKNFHYRSLHHDVEPVVLEITPNAMFCNYLSVRLNAERMNQNIQDIKKIWSSVMGNEPFDYFFIDQTLATQYKNEKHLNSIIYYFTILAIIIACLGLFGLSIFTVEQKQKEMSIRKVLGANLFQIVFMFLGEFSKWVIMANLIAIPFSLLFMNFWLTRFTYQTKSNIYIFIITILLSMTIAMLTVCIQVYRAARANPVNSLHHE